MIGGEADAVGHLDPIVKTLAPGRGSQVRTPARTNPKATAEEGYRLCGPAGAGHSVEMVHNGIEYGLMSAYAEGLNLVRHANAGAARRTVDAETAPMRNPERYQYDFDVDGIAEVWRRGSVVASWLLDLTATALADKADLHHFSGRLSDSGEGRWAILSAIEASAPAPVLTTASISDSRRAERTSSPLGCCPRMRLQFGGHVETRAGV